MSRDCDISFTRREKHCRSCWWPLKASRKEGETSSDWNFNETGLHWRIINALTALNFYLTEESEEINLITRKLYCKIWSSFVFISFGFMFWLWLREKRSASFAEYLNISISISALQTIPFLLCELLLDSLDFTETFSHLCVNDLSMFLSFAELVHFL